MKCVVPGVNLKVFGRAIHSLAKIGDEVYFEPLEQGLSLRTVNSSRSAYACFLFFPSYFHHYDDGKKQTEPGDTEEEEGLRCKVTVKSIMAVFRSLSTIEKTVEKCKIIHKAREAHLVFELYCRHGIVKKHNLAYIECETMQAIFSKDLCPNKMTAPPKLLCEVVVNFQTTQEEVTLSVRPENLSFKNYVEDEPDPAKVVHTELSLAPEEFDHYQVGVDTDITFCLKELRAILAFGETTGLPLHISFETAGRPVTFCIDSDQTFEANFVLATLADVEQTSSQHPSSQRPPETASAGQNHRKTPASSLAATSSRHGGSREVKTTAVSVHRPPPPHTTVGTDNDNNSAHPADISAEELAAAMEAEGEWEEEEKRGGASRDRPLQGEGEQRIEQPVEGEGQEAEEEEGGWQAEESSPVIPLQCHSPGQRRERPCLQPLEEEEGEDLDDTVPGTPPAKKFRSLFFGSSQKNSQPQVASDVLAADTDEDD